MDDFDLRTLGVLTSGFVLGVVITAACQAISPDDWLVPSLVLCLIAGVANGLFWSCYVD